jgi:hypothetical protein
LASRKCCHLAICKPWLTTNWHGQDVDFARISAAPTRRANGEKRRLQARNRPFRASRAARHPQHIPALPRGNAIRKGPGDYPSTCEWWSRRESPDAGSARPRGGEHARRNPASAPRPAVSIPAQGRVQEQKARMGPFALDGGGQATGIKLTLACR